MGPSVGFFLFGVRTWHILVFRVFTWENLFLYLSRTFNLIQNYRRLSWGHSTYTYEIKV